MPTINDKSTASANSPNDVKPNEIGVKTETTQVSQLAAQLEETKLDGAKPSI